MRTMIVGFMTIGLICSNILSIAVHAEDNGVQIAQGLVRFEKPMYQGYRLDWCLGWASNCGEPAASAWCKTKNYNGANSWQQAPDIGGASHTKVLQTGQICDQAFCDGFAEIVCDALEPGIIVDFVAKAPEAKWTNAWQELKFPGDPSDSKGFVRYIDNAQLEDNKIYKRALQAHPHWQPRGRIVGRYFNIKIPDYGAEFRAEIGFLGGAASSDGVYFEIWAEFPGYSEIPLRREYYKKYSKYLINDFSQDLSRFRGMTGTIALSVDAGEKSSTQDWAVWVKPRLVSMQNEFKFGGFVGGAVGSGRSGDQLLDPWGGKSGQLYGNVVLYLAFADSGTQMDYSVKIESYYKGQHMGTTDLGTVKAGQKALWFTLVRTQQGPWKEEIVFNGTYVGDLRYNISKVGE